LTVVDTKLRKKIKTRRKKKGALTENTNKSVSYSLGIQRERGKNDSQAEKKDIEKLKRKTKRLMG
jgi:hypothetical protein